MDSAMNDPNDLENIIDNLENIRISEKNELLTYINTLPIEYNIKKYLYDLIENDNHTDYLTIYNICMENDIELPPF
jgi:hypothetical protein